MLFLHALQLALTFPQEIVVLLEKQLRPLVQAELSVLVDVLHCPEALFPAGTKCEIGGFISRSALHISVLINYDCMVILCFNWVFFFCLAGRMEQLRMQSKPFFFTWLLNILDIFVLIVTVIKIASFIFFVTFFVIRIVLMLFSYDVVTRFRLIRHTKCLLEEKEDSLCIKVLQTLREMMTVDNEYGEKVQIINF